MSKSKTVLGTISGLLALGLAAVGIPSTSAQNNPEAGSTSESAPTPVVASERDLTREDLNEWLDGFMGYALPDGDVAGAVVVIVKDGQILTQRGFGVADVASAKPVDPEQTLFRPGSVSKLVTWTAVMQQVEQGRIDLDGDVNQYLDFTIPAYNGKPVTMRNLMTHTAGFEEQLKQLIVHDADDAPPFDVLLKRWVPQRIFAPGTTPAYSNYATSLAGYIVQRVSGEPFTDYVQKHIFGPLEMRDSTFVQPLPARLQKRMSTGYEKASGDPVDYEFAGPVPAGSMASTATDMARFMMAHLNDGELDGRRILETATAQRMHSEGNTVIPGLDRMLLGFFETGINGRRVIGHLGDTKAFHSSLHLFLDDDVGLFVSLNSSGKEGAANRIRIALFEQFADRYFPGRSARLKLGVPEDLAQQHAAMMVGNWIGSRRASSNFANLTQLLGQLTLGVTSDGSLDVPTGVMLTGRPAKWVEVAPFEWHDRNSHMKLAAVVEDGEIKRFSMSFLSAFTVFERPVWYKNSALIMPLLYAALAVLLLTGLLWPVRALVRRGVHGNLPLEGQDRLAYRGSRIAAILILLILLGWVLVFTKIMDTLGVGLDGLILTIQALTAIVLVFQIVVFAWYAWRMWRGPHGWRAKVWSLTLCLAGLMVLWVAVAFHLLGFGTNF